MVSQMATLDDLVKRAQGRPPVRVAVVAADQGLVLESVKQAEKAGIVEPRLIGDRDAILARAGEIGIETDRWPIIAANGEAQSARAGVDLVRNGDADVVMKGQIHTDVFMRALLDAEHGLRLPGKRVSHVFIIDIPTYPKLFAVTDAAINIAPDLNAKVQILENAISLLHSLGMPTPKAAVLSAVETVNPAIASSLDAACITLMAKRGQIGGAVVDGPLAFDNAVSADAAREKGIVSEVAGDADILLVPDLVSGNILAKNLEHLAGATAAGIVMGLSAPVVLSSRADPPAARTAALALAALLHRPSPESGPAVETESAIHCAPQPESACCPIGA